MAKTTSTSTELGPGPLRFAHPNERPVAEQLASLTPAEKTCVEELKAAWKAQPHSVPFIDEMILRFARNSPGPTKFNSKTALKVMKKYDRRYSALTAARLESQLLTQTSCRV